MIEIQQAPEFIAWLDSLKDKKLRAAVLARLGRLALGNSGDVAPVGGGLSELRIHRGAGHRIYIVARGPEMVILLGGGTKKTQVADIQRAKALAEILELKT